MKKRNPGIGSVSNMSKPNVAEDVMEGDKHKITDQTAQAFDLANARLEAANNAAQARKAELDLVVMAIRVEASENGKYEVTAYDPSTRTVTRVPAK